MPLEKRIWRQYCQKRCCREIRRIQIFRPTLPTRQDLQNSAKKVWTIVQPQYSQTPPLNPPRNPQNDSQPPINQEPKTPENLRKTMTSTPHRQQVPPSGMVRPLSGGLIEDFSIISDTGIRRTSRRKSVTNSAKKRKMRAKRTSLLGFVTTPESQQKNELM